MYRRLLFGIRPIFSVLIILPLFFSCNDSDKVAEDIAKVEVDLDIVRFDREFAKAETSDIPELKVEFPYLFPEQYTDSVWEAKLTDTLQIELLDEVGKAFPDFKEESEDLERLFQHIKYYFPNTSVPKVITLTSDVQYQNRVILADSLLLIGLDNYLGKEHKFYGGIDKYIASGLDKKYLVSDVASAFSNRLVAPSNDRTFLAQMIRYGKELYLKDKLIPFENEAVRIGYTEDQMDWAYANEEQIWRYFIEREYLYSTDNKLGPRFLDPAPFSKFQLELDNESPGRLGRFIGWQIVRAFMERNTIELRQLLNIPAEEIFKKSNYKPKK